jgi:hypothetical protein
MNGTSLNENLHELSTLDRNNHKFAVSNFFLNSNFYDNLKPDYYFLSDPLFFKTNNDKINLFFKNLYNQTNWPLVLIIDSKYLSNRNIELLKNNNNITILTYKYITMYFGNFNFNKFLFNFFNSSPFFQNVLVSMLSFFIKNDFKKICIWGANHDWFLNFNLDINNILTLKDYHFYNSSIKTTSLHHNSNNLFLQFRNLTILHYSYRFLSYVSKTKNIKIINMNENSWIDSFEKYNKNESLFHF